MTEFIRDPRFKAHGYAYAIGADAAPKWVETVEPMDWSNTVVIAHNVKFDGAILAWRYGVQPYAWFDTCALARAVLGETVSGYSLATVAEFLGLDEKGELTCDGIHNPTPEQLAALGKYCENDVRLCQGIFKALFHKFPQSQLWHMDWTIRAFIDAQLTLDTAMLEKGVHDEKKRRDEAIQHSGVDRETLSSNKKFAEHLAARGFDVPTKRSTRTGKQIPAFAKTDEGLAAVLADDGGLYQARLAAKSSLLETRGESLLAVGHTGAFPFDVNFSGAVQTHRYSGGSGAGGNPQNFTRGSFLRGSVSAPAGAGLVVGDFSAIELRVLAWLAREPKLINAIIENADIYSDFASRFYGRAVTKADKVERQFGKCAILGLGYGMGANKFKATVKAQLKIDLTDAQAKQTVDLYRTTYFNVPRLWESAQQAIQLIADGRVSCLHFAPFIKVRKNALILPSGLAIQYPNLRATKGRFNRVEWVYDKYFKKTKTEDVRLYGGKVIENLCQGLAGEICKEALYRAECASLKCVGAVHDEIIAVCSRPNAGELLLSVAMERSPAWWPEIRLKAEVNSGTNWLEAK